MTPEEVKAKVRAVLAVCRKKIKCAVWVSESHQPMGGRWLLCTRKPNKDTYGNWTQAGWVSSIPAVFDVDPFPGEQRESLVER
jgi:hypothetical protein